LQDFLTGSHLLTFFGAQWLFLFHPQQPQPPLTSIISSVFNSRIIFSKVAVYNTAVV
jgi:hypothetical protein